LPCWVFLDEILDAGVLGLFPRTTVTHKDDAIAALHRSCVGDEVAPVTIGATIAANRRSAHSIA
jgi:hypothetical protein